MQYDLLLSQVQLTPHERAVYISLLEHGARTASQLAQDVKIKRTLVYYVLDGLMKNTLVEESTVAKKRVFRLTHPQYLERYVERQQTAVQAVLDQVRAALPGLTSNYNMHHHQPNVYHFEGQAGLIREYDKLLEDRLPIDSIEEKGDMLECIAEYVPVYIKKRIRYKLSNRAIAPSTNVLNAPDPKSFRDAHFIDVKKFPFPMDIKINDRRVIMATFQQHGPVGVVIMDPEITKNMKLLFEFLWEVTMPKKKS